MTTYSIKKRNGSYTTKTFAKGTTTAEMEAYWDKLSEVGSKVIGITSK